MRHFPIRPITGRASLPLQGPAPPKRPSSVLGSDRHEFAVITLSLHPSPFISSCAGHANNKPQQTQTSLLDSARDCAGAPLDLSDATVSHISGAEIQRLHLLVRACKGRSQGDPSVSRVNCAATSASLYHTPVSRFSSSGAGLKSLPIPSHRLPKAGRRVYQTDQAPLNGSDKRELNNLTLENACRH